jgi:hypothetical protein
MGDGRRKRQPYEWDGRPVKKTPGRGLRKKKKASRSLRAAGLFIFYCRRGCDHPEGRRLSSSVCALAKTTNLWAA